jgi:hypothetical protein
LGVYWLFFWEGGKNPLFEVSKLKKSIRQLLEGIHPNGFCLLDLLLDLAFPLQKKFFSCFELIKCLLPFLQALCDGVGTIFHVLLSFESKSLASGAGQTIA